MPEIDNDKALTWVKGLRVRLDRPLVTLTWPHGRLKAKAGVLRVLEVFSHPRTLREVTDEVRFATQGELLRFIDLTRNLILAGALINAESSVDSDFGFGRAATHIAMLNDKERTLAFIRALEEVVEPTDIVLDLGAGTGVLAATAARLGAKKVYAVESGPAGRIAVEVAEKNGFQDVIEVCNRWSTDVSFDEKATVVVSETLGNQPLAENILTYLWDARQRLCTPGATFIPNRLEILGILLSESEIGQKSSCSLEDWSDYNLDLSPVVDWKSRSKGALTAVEPESLERVTKVRFPVSLWERSLPTSVEESLTGTVRFESSWEHEMSGVALAFRATLSPKTTLSTVPGESRSSHWRLPIFRLKQTVAVKASRQYRLDFSLTPGEESFCVSPI